MNVPRRYSMITRSESTRRTRQRILDAATALLGERLRSDIHLESIAERARVGIQTVIRHFGSRANLLAEAVDLVRLQHVAQRPVKAGDIAHGVSVLFDQYEALGDLVIRNLAQEDADPGLKEMLEVGRAFHREWVRAQFLPVAGAVDLPTDELIDSLVVACDVYVWKLLRRDLGRERGPAERTMHRLVAGALHNTSLGAGG